MLSFIRKIQNITCIILLGAALASCQDDLLYDDSYIGEGDATLLSTVSFNPMGTGLDTRSSGTAVKTINNLCVIIYKANGEFYKKFMANELAGYDCDQTGNEDMPTDNKPAPYDQAEEKTPRATFSYETIPFGKYRIYAVANLGMLNDDITATEESLKAYAVGWETDASKDNAMFGYFTSANDQKSAGFNAPEIVVNKNSMSIHCWIKRLVSKVTIAFDPSGLKEHVAIYIKSATIHDIPATCKLGENNKPTSDKEIIANGETIYYGDGKTAGTDYSGWLRLQKGSGIQGSKDHKETDDALYFYENMQGDFQDQKDYLKEQIPKETGSSVNTPDYNPDGTIKNDFKDRVKYGSYIEVIGYYVSQNEDKMSEGPIKYRFMLGQNVTYNYDAQRNYHYKLTLKFRGWANEADWHIVYDEMEPTVYVPNPFFISYLYDQSMELPVRITGGDPVRKYKLHAEIIENNWAPYDYTNKTVPPGTTGAYNDIYGLAWNEYAYKNTYKDANYVGFLSMRRTTNAIIGNTMTFGAAADEELKNYYLGNPNSFGQVSPRFFADYSLEKDAQDLPINGSADNGTYDVTSDPEDKSITVRLPMYTRAKQMVPASDFTANNPFDSYWRKAVVRFSLREIGALDPTDDETYNSGADVQFKVKDVEGNEKEVRYKDVIVYQVPRIVNPKAIWRKAGSQEPFHVQLMQINNPGDNFFGTFTSEGPWRASIMVDNEGLIKLSADGQDDVTTQGKYIEGSTGTTIDFTYTPNGTIGANQTRCGIILVEYHGYTCRHLIFVRQGYDAGVELGGAKWSCYNAFATVVPGKANQAVPENNLARTDVVVTNSPLSVGSYFKRCQYNYAILEENNANCGWLASVTNRDLTTAYTSGTGFTKRISGWGNIQGFGWNNYANTESRFESKWAETWRAVNKSNINLAMPTFEQYKNLRDQSEYGYGVVYGDGAKGVKTSFEDAYGYTDYENVGVESDKGIRACLVYDKNNGNQIIFPLGSIGQARRIRRNPFANEYHSETNSNKLTDMNNPGAGTLSYGSFRGLLYSNLEGNNNHRPLTYNIYRSAGALYWFKQPGYRVYSNDGDKRTASWDINYFTLMFNAFDYASLGDGSLNNTSASDALPIKLIYK